MLKQAVESLESENADLRAQVARLANDYSESLALLNVAQSANAELALLAKSYRKEDEDAQFVLGRLRKELALARAGCKADRLAIAARTVGYAQEVAALRGEILTLCKQEVEK